MKAVSISLNDSLILQIPQTLLEESGLGKRVTLQAKKGEIKIVSDDKKKNVVSDTLILSEKSLVKDWEKPEEDAAWKSLQ